MIYVGLNFRKILYKEPGHVFVDHFEQVTGKPFIHTLLFEYYENFIFHNQSRLENTLLYAILQNDIKEHFIKIGRKL